MVSTSTVLKNADAAIELDAHALRAGITNVFYLRAEQLGRKFLTPVDARKIEIIISVMLADDDPDVVSSTRIAPQAQEPVVSPEALAEIEKALTP